MPLQLKKLCQNSDYLYGMRVLTGSQGMNNIVKWVHTIEDIEAGEFLHGGELIFTTGIARQNGEWLLKFVESLIDKNAAGLVVNVGPYIEKVPDNVLEYSTKFDFPILEVPWRTRLVDMTRDFCNQIIKDEQNELLISDTFKKILIEHTVTSQGADILKQYGYYQNQYYCVCVIQCNALQEVRDNLIKALPERIEFLQVESYAVVVLTENQINIIENVVEIIVEKCNNNKSEIHIGIGPKVMGIRDICKSYTNALHMMIYSRNTNRTIANYSDVKLERLLISVDDSILNDYYNDVLKNLEQYDKDHNTEYLILLRKYIEYDGSILRISNETNQHRNTINYKLNKIKNILNTDIGTLDNKINLLVAFKIRDISQ